MDPFDIENDGLEAVGMPLEESPLEEIPTGGIIEHLPDGGEAIYTDAEMEHFGAPQSHFDNLAKYLSAYELKGYSAKIAKAIGVDNDSRKEWLDRLTSSLDLLGINNKSVDWPFPGASNSVSPAFMQAWLNLTAQARAELLRVNGCADTEIVGVENEELKASAQRIKDYLNYLLLQKMDYYTQREKTIAWSLLYGSMFTKIYFDPNKNIPWAPFIKPENLIVAYSANSLEDAQRITEVQYVAENEFKARVRAGLYKQLDLRPYQKGAVDNSEGELSEKVDEIQGIELVDEDLTDKVFKLYECHTYIDIPQFRPLDEHGNEIPMALPYVITFDATTYEVVSLYRNWKEGDFNFKPIQHFVHWSPLPGLGFYGFGLVHTVGSIAETCTKATRMLLDAAILSNFPSFLRARGLRTQESTIRIAPMSVTDVDVGSFASLDAAFKALPFHEPSATLKMMKDEGEKSLLDLVGAANQPFGEGGIGANQPVGTTLAVIEQSQRTQSSIMRRFHESLGHELKMIAQIIAENMANETYPFDVTRKGIEAPQPEQAMGGGEDVDPMAIMQQQIAAQQSAQNHPVTLGQDFLRQDMKIIPIADPNVNSSTQRLIRAESLYNFSSQLAGAGVQVNMREVASRLFAELKVDNIDAILPPEQEVKPLDPLTENMNLMTSKPVRAGIWQDHQAHIAAHTQLLQAKQEDPQATAAIQAHINEHQAYAYMVEMQSAMGMDMPEDVNSLTPEQQNAIAAKVGEIAQQQMQQQQAQQQQQPQPIDPNMVYLEDIKVKDKGLEVKVALDSQKLELEKYKLETEARIQMEKIAMEREKAANELKLKDEIEALKAQIELLRVKKEDEPRETFDIHE